MRQHFLKAFFLGVMCLLWSAVAVSAQESPQAVVQKTVNDVVSQLKKNQSQLKTNTTLLQQLVKEDLFPVVDFDYMLQQAFGPAWRKATAAQKAQIKANFKQLLLRTYSAILKNYDGQTVRVFPIRGGVSGKVGSTAVIRTAIQSPGQQPLSVDYRLVLGQDQKWRMYDIVVSGVSVLSNYRSQFQSIVRSQGIDGVIKQLQQLSSRGGANG